MRRGWVGWIFFGAVGGCDGVEVWGIRDVIGRLHAAPCWRIRLPFGLHPTIEERPYY